MPRNMENFVERRNTMKRKMFLIDKISIFFSIYNVVSYLLLGLIPEMTYDGSLLYSVLSLNVLNVVFMTPFIILAMLVTNLIVFIKKRKNNVNKAVNVILIVIFILMIPIWNRFFWQAMMGV